VQRARACRPNQPGTPDQLRPLGEVSLWSCGYGSVPSLLVVYTEWVPARAKRNCNVSCNDGSVNLEKGISKEERKWGGPNRHSAIFLWAGRDWGDKDISVLLPPGVGIHVQASGQTRKNLMFTKRSERRCVFDSHWEGNEYLHVAIHVTR
jgi:hypothetical protein